MVFLMQFFWFMTQQADSLLAGPLLFIDQALDNYKLDLLRAQIPPRYQLHRVVAASSRAQGGTSHVAMTRQPSKQMTRASQAVCWCPRCTNLPEDSANPPPQKNQKRIFGRAISLSAGTRHTVCTRRMMVSTTRASSLPTGMWCAPAQRTRPSRNRG